MNDTDRFDLTAEQARELHETGRLEIWTVIEPLLVKQVESRLSQFPNSFEAYGPMTAGNLRLIRKNLLQKHAPHGPDREVWIAEPYMKFKGGYTSGNRVIYKASYSGSDILLWYKPYMMSRHESRASADLTTTAERRDGVWGFAETLAIKG